MKRTITLIIILLSTHIAFSQSAICKQFLQQKGIQTYCADNYPLGNDDSIGVTFLMATDSASFSSLMHYMLDLPDAKSSTIGKNGNNMSKKNHSFIIRLSEALSNDKGYYLTFFSSHNMTAMIFHIKNNNDMQKVISHVLTKEVSID